MTLRSLWRADKEEVVAKNGVVTAMEPPSAEAGLAMLKAGGNAIDAAVAMGFCNVVLEPYMATIAGLGYMVIHLAKEGKTIGVDFNGRAPKRAHPELFDVLGPAPAGGINVFLVKDDANMHGPLSITVPGTTAGFCEVHRRYGGLPLAQVLEPAIALASDGFEANWHTTLSMSNSFAAVAADPYLANMWLPGGRPPRSFPRPGDKIVQRDLGDLLRRIAKHGAAGLHGGEVADGIDAWMRNNGGILTKQDLADYQPTLGEPIRGRFKGYDIACVATPSGALTNLEIFNILSHLDLDGLAHNSPEYLHLLIEAARHAFADRYRYLGDWQHAAVPLQGLLNPDYARQIAKLVKPGRTQIEIEGDFEPWGYYIDRAIHDPWEFEPSSAPTGSRHATPSLIPAEDTTTHLNVVDKDRNAVACTHTGGWGDVHPANTGAYLTHGMAWFNPLPNHANSIAPWKRPMNNMCPIMVFKGGRPVILQGAPGARKIMHRGVQVLLNQVLFDLGPQAAITAITVDASGRDTHVDSRLPDATIDQLRAMGHQIKLVEEEPGATGNFSRPSAVQIDHERGLLRAGVDPFRPAIALGY